jgi:cysteinyl-tRNA synthetase, unknown class
LSYLSIGEAEDYRAYWKSNWKPGMPMFIDKQNPDWKGNYKVKYWDTQWQNIILDRVTQIVNKGYDGVYLDVIDAYEYYEQQGNTKARSQMISFVTKISSQARKLNPDFLIIPQNSPELYSYAEYKNSINGLGKESTWYNGNTKQDASETLQYLDAAINDGKLVLSIDYPTSKENICDYYEQCRSHNFACLVSNRALDLDKPIECTE